MEKRVYSAITIGGSAGVIDALLKIFSHLPETFSLPIIVVCHLHPRDGGDLIELFSRQVRLKVKEAADKGPIEAGHIYFPTANYHLLVERDRTFALSVDEKVKYARPSIDVLFDSAAVAWEDELIGILLTGANSDGSTGIRAIKQYGGLTIAQDPGEAKHPIMPQAAIDTGDVDHILTIEEISDFLESLGVNVDDSAKRV